MPPRRTTTHSNRGGSNPVALPGRAGMGGWGGAVGDLVTVVELLPVVDRPRAAPAGPPAPPDPACRGWRRTLLEQRAALSTRTGPGAPSGSNARGAAGRGAHGAAIAGVEGPSQPRRLRQRVSVLPMNRSCCGASSPLRATQKGSGMGPEDEPAVQARWAEQEMIQRRRDAALRWPKLLNEIRQVPGFEGFALPPPIESLHAAAGEGTVVALIVTNHGCGALLLTQTDADYIELSELSAQAAFDNANSFLRAVNPALGQPVDPGEMTRILDWLWDAIAGPVLDRLGHHPSTLDPATGRDWPRVWWIPTGPLSVLPIHAAGNGSAGQSVLDRVVSSYTPSVRALGDARNATTTGRVGTSALIVGINNTADAVMDPLTQAQEEAKQVWRRLAAGAAPVLGQDATRGQVTARLPEASWAHFACHGFADNADPSQSFLALYDGNLPASELFTMRLTEPYLAYLSACSTGVPSTGLLDESIHLASAFQLAGYPHVVATLWRIDDFVAADLARDFYTAVRPDAAASVQPAYALHATIHSYRKTYPDSPHLWASHIHFGP
jgi:hypothetical protein